MHSVYDYRKQLAFDDGGITDPDKKVEAEKKAEAFEKRLADIAAKVAAFRAAGRRITLAVVQQKGGTTKTTTTVLLAQALVMMGLRVRIWDADPQSGSATLWLTPQSEVGRGLLEVYNDAYTVDQVTSLTGFPWLYVVPSWPDLRKIEQTRPPGSEVVLKQAVATSTAPVDVEIIDAPPNLDVIMAGAVTAADELVVPVQASALDLSGMQELLGVHEAVRRRYSPNLTIGAIVIGRAKPKAVYDLSVLDGFRSAYPEAIVTYVPDAVKVREAVDMHMPFQLYVKGAKNPVNMQLSQFAAAFVDRWSKP